MGRKERLKGAVIASASTLVMIVAGWLLWIRADVAAENERKSILTTTGRLAAYEQLYCDAELARSLARSAADEARLIEVQVMILDGIAVEQD